MEPIRVVQLEGLSAQLLGVTISFTILCTLVLVLRMWLRYKDAQLGLEDWLMLVGATFNQLHNGVVVWGTLIGIGTPDDKLALANMLEGAKVIMYWQLSYVVGSLFIKSSICATLIRISAKRRYKWLLVGMIALTTVTTIAAMTVVLVRCKPIAANWDPTVGVCLNLDLVVVFTYIVSAMNIFTDWSVAIIPMFILWDLQMQPRMKLVTSGVLGIGVFMPARTFLTVASDNIAHIVLWTVVECAMGIIAGCLPMLRKLIHGYLAESFSAPVRLDQPETELVTIGRLGKKHNGVSTLFDASVTRSRTATVGHGDEDGIGDSDSTRRIIKATRSMEQMRSDSR
ncbi:hypothetical protein Micbo1qcDRAFT_181946 [Microdochium bolleyi]|uniref:Rhodopsin domain-containing protein n=1 Tax=Microdochium bolleyi TaxID=196109 RepID=A0A136JKL2_9PEZI|nr:hypothetical protein Micbo1qcDRAFT_181946 [Microdochium bolleyi]